MQRFAVLFVRTEQLREAFSPLRTSTATTLRLPVGRNKQRRLVGSSVVGLAPPFGKCVYRLSHRQGKLPSLRRA
jgi:hypothetical protein